VAPAALLAHLAEPPPGKVAARFDRIDHKKIDEVCGDTLCFWGATRRLRSWPPARPSG